ncbi:alpha/beta fold hydrolase [Noviherbaspirillum humi]|nr:alpha/beta hydrolase [Noviherbaspirillum humi]
MKPSRSEFIMVRGLRYHLRHWGSEGAPKLFMMHGWMDMSASFQFVVDCLRRDWHVIAADWRGFGLTETPAADSYWFPDYLGDLDAILDHCAGAEPVNLLGHSMGGNVVTLYAGVRPERIRRLINLEGFGLPAAAPEKAPARYREWLDELKQDPALRPYASRAEVAQRLRKNNPRLTPERAEFLSGYWAAENADGSWRLLADPAHKRVNPILYRVEEVLACWRGITAPVLWVEADDTTAWRWMGPKDQARAEIDRRIAMIQDVRTLMVEDAGHMLHHDQPEILASAIEEFLA